MRDYNLDDNDKMIHETLINNSSERNDLLLNLIDILSHCDKGVFSIEGSWGCGKTFFVKQLKYIYDNMKDIKNIKTSVNSDENIDCIKDKLINTNVYYYNAWKNDYSKEPALNLIASLGCYHIFR